MSGEMIRLHLTFDAASSEGLAHLKKEAQLLPQLPKCTELVLDTHYFHPSGIEALAREVPPLPNVFKLTISRITLDAACGRALGKLLLKLPNLNFLYFLRNEFKRGGVAKLAEAMATLQDLDTLMLFGNMCALMSMEALAVVLPKLPKLTNLHLDCNDLGPTRFSQLVQPLKQTPLQALTVLTVENNELGPQGVTHLVELLKCTPNLTSLELDHNRFGVDELKRIINALQTLRKLTCLPLAIYKLSLNSAFLSALLELYVINERMYHWVLYHRCRIPDIRAFLHWVAGTESSLKRNAQGVAAVELFRRDGDGAVTRRVHKWLVG